MSYFSVWSNRSIVLSRPPLKLKKVVNMEAESGIQCPRCKSDAWHHFGKTSTGKRRYICKVCSRQFIVDYAYRSIIHNRPSCPQCGAFMHVYMRDRSHIRFRCSSYPRCPCFLKTEIESPNAVSERPIRTLPLYRRNPLLRKRVVVPWKARKTSCASLLNQWGGKTARRLSFWPTVRRPEPIAIRCVLAAGFIMLPAIGASTATIWPGWFISCGRRSSPKNKIPIHTIYSIHSRTE